MRFVIFLVATLICLPAVAAEPDARDYRWLGHDFAFCFMTDDGVQSNLAWAETARDMGFRFTIAINLYMDINASYGALTLQEIRDLEADGFEIANHSYSHGKLGLPETCSLPPKGSLMGYFLCDDLDPVEAMDALHVEIERDSIAARCDLDVSSIRTVAYPRHLHGKALIDSLIAEGYIGARTGGWTMPEEYSYGEFTFQSYNSWDGGISLFRVPTRISDAGLFGDHSATPPVHYTYEQFLEIAQPRIDDLRQRGGIFVLYTHHLGDDDDTYGDINYGSGGITKTDLEWMVELVRANGGLILPFGDAVAFYRSRTSMVKMGGDYVWMPDITPAMTPELTEPLLLFASPNPFNPRTLFNTDLPVAGAIRLEVFDIHGGLVRTLASGYYDLGPYTWAWDGLDGEGRSMSAGVYLARLNTSMGEATRKVILLK